MRRNTPLWFLVAVLMLVPAFVFGQGFQTGSIVVIAKDATGAALPGVSVTVTSEDRGTQRTAVTDNSGRANFAALGLGTYTAEAALSGFQNAVRRGNRVEADKTNEITLTLALAAATETITVTGEQPVVDRTNVTANTQVSSKEFEKAPVGRSYQSIVLFTPGVAGAPGANANPQVHGALSGNNVFLFDGVDTTDTTTGTFGANLNFEAIQEVSVQTAGMSAEYGRAQGAVINVITKSGTNEFQGSGKGILTNDRWNAQNKTENQVTGASLARNRTNTPVWRYAATLGGPIWKDHLWFFGAYEKTTSSGAAATTTHSAEEYTQVTNVKLPVYRLSAQITPTQSLWAAYAEDPITGFIVNYWGGLGNTELFALTGQDQGGDKKTAQYAGVFGTNVTLEALYGESTGVITVAPFKLSPLHNGAPHYSLADNKVYNGSAFDGFVDRPRKQAVVAGSYFATIGGNSHNFKAGIDWQDLKSSNFFRYPNGQLYVDESFDFRTRQFVPFQRQDFIDLPSTSKGTLTAFYVRDKFDLGGRFFVEAGLRYETEEAENDQGTTVLDAASIAPRFQASYDLFGTGRTILLGTAGRIYQSITQAFADTFAQNPQQSNYDLYEWDGAKYVFAESVRVGAGNSLLNLDLEPSYLDEITVGAQQQLGPTVGVGVRYIHRTWKDLVDDIEFVGPNGPTLRFENVSNAKRDYNGLELTFEKRFARHWSLLANYTYSEVKGNFFPAQSGATGDALNDFSAQNCTTTADRTIGNNGTVPCSELDRLLEGHPTWDIPHIFNLLGTYVFSLGPVNLTAGAAGNYQSGVRYSKTRAMTVSGTGSTRNYFYEGQGSDRAPAVYALDTSLEATYRLFSTVDIGGKLEIFNVTDFQGQRSVNNTTWTNATGAAADTTRANFGKATARGSFMPPRSFRVTYLIRF